MGRIESYLAGYSDGRSDAGHGLLIELDGDKGRDYVDGYLAGHQDGRLQAR